MELGQQRGSLQWFDPIVFLAMPCNALQSIQKHLHAKESGGSNQEPGHEVEDDSQAKQSTVNWEIPLSLTFAPLQIHLLNVGSAIISGFRLPATHPVMTIPSKWHIWSEAFSPESFPVKQLALWDTPSGTSCRRGASNMFLWIARISFTKVHSHVASSSVLKFRNILNRQSLSKYWKTLKKQQFMFLHLLSSYPSHNHYSVENDNSVRETNLGGIPIFYSLPWLPWFLRESIEQSILQHLTFTTDWRHPRPAPSSHQLRPHQRQPTQLPSSRQVDEFRSWKQMEDFFT